MKKIVFQDGTEMLGTAIGIKGNYFGKVKIEKNYYHYEKALNENDGIVLFTYPLIGNYGVETIQPKAKAMIVHELCDQPNHYQQVKTLNEALVEHQIIGIQDVDTREIAKKLYHTNESILICDVNTTQEEIANYFKGDQYA